MNHRLVLAGLLSVGCAGKDHCADGAASPSGADPVPIQTDDGLCLVGDHYRAGAGAPAVVFLHMTPLSWDRKSWSADFVRRVYAEGWTVLNLDRRGAGDSEGNATDAFDGAGGALDVKAAFDYLAEDGVGPLAIVSASNGTTSALDYTELAAAQGLVEPVSIVMMSPGDYTENQTSIEALSDQRTATLFQYDPAEGFWLDSRFDELDPGDWQAIPYDGAGHGSQMLDSDNEVDTDILDFLSENWPQLP